MSLEKGEERHRHGGEGQVKTHGKTEAEIGIMPLQAKEHLESPEETGKDSPSDPPEGTQPADTLISDFWSLEL